MQQQASVMSRPLSRPERYSLCRRRIGTPAVLVYMASFKSSSNQAVTADDLRNRLESLVKKYPILESSVAKAGTNKPELVHAPLPEDELFKRVRESNVSLIPDKNAQEAIFEECLSWGSASAFDAESGHLWQVGLLFEPTNSKTYVVLCIDHLLSDGAGSLQLFADLLNAEPSTQNGSALLPPAIEERVNTKPSKTTLAKAIFHAIVVPKLPTWLLPSYLKPQAFWPYEEDISKKPSTVPSTVSSAPLSVSTSVLVGGWTGAQASQLRTVFSGPKGTASLHAIFSACAACALWITEENQKEYQGRRQLPLKIGTPTSERRASLGHPKATGNYVGIVDTEVSIDISTDLSSLAVQIGTHIKSVVAAKATTGAWGLLDYIDDPEITEEQHDRRTGWEQYLEEKARSDKPYGTSLEVSNLGLAPELDAVVESGLSSIDWVQAAACAGAAITINVVGRRPSDPNERMGDISFSLSWREGGAPTGRLDRQRVEEFKGILEGLPAVIIDGAAADSTLTFENIRQRLG